MPTVTVITQINTDNKPCWAIGNTDLLNLPLLGLFCSVRCPGDAILQTYDLVRAFRDAGVPVIGGFHSPMERECLDYLLRGTQPVVICPARGIQTMRIPAAWRQPLQEGRLLIVSPFSVTQRRPTAKLAEQRNQFVAELASAVFVAYAEAGGNTEWFCTALLAQGKSVYTHALASNQPLVDRGACSGGIEFLVQRCAVSLS